VPNSVSFVASIAELAHREKLHTQSLTQPAYLMPQEPKLMLQKKTKTGLSNFHAIWPIPQISGAAMGVHITAQSPSVCLPPSCHKQPMTELVQNN